MKHHCPMCGEQWNEDQCQTCGWREGATPRATTGRRQTKGQRIRRAPARPSTGNRYQPLVAALCRAESWPEPLAEQRLIPGRRFSCDLVWPGHRLVVEVQGGIWAARGGHTGGAAQRDDMEKLNLLQLDGWRVLQVTPEQTKNGVLRDLMRRVFEPETANSDRLAHVEPVVRAAVEWWVGRRPVQWSEAEHVANPTINTAGSDRDQALAEAVGALVRRQS